VKIKEVITSQYMAALEMLAQAITQCPQNLWADPDDQNQFWHVAYHALFYTHLYLQPTEADFQPWEKHLGGLQSFDNLPKLLEENTDKGLPFSKEDLLDYLDFCRQVVRDRVPDTDLEAESGFDWIPFDKLQLQFYNIRHIQHHTGELYERLGTRAGIEVRWVGMGPNEML
jgi:diadenosine tetraphosphatase ApaH/serine/threonine PP2A family protein phosphatase